MDVKMDSQKPTVRTSRSGSATLLTVPSERYGGLNKRSSSGIKFNEILFEDESEVIKNCFDISFAVFGLMKSFSTSDICGLNDMSSQTPVLRQSSSEMQLFGGPSRLELPNLRRLDYTSRSCSTWVNLGDPVLSTSQLPSPQAQSAKTLESPTITSIDFIKSVNKKVRQMYLKRRLRAIGRLYNSLQMNAGANERSRHMSANTSNVSPLSTDNSKSLTNETKTPNVHIQECSALKTVCAPFDLSNLCFRSVDGALRLTVKDIERDKGKPLSKYERNIMIFNWLQDVDEEQTTENHTIDSS